MVAAGLATLTGLVGHSARALVTAPTTPTEISLTAVTTKSCPADSRCVQISWAASVDDSSKRVMYRIERNGEVIGWAQAPMNLGYRPSFRDAGAAWGTNRYRVMAVGEGGATSAWSAAVEIVMGTGCV
jgi:hypothetical protein